MNRQINPFKALGFDPSALHKLADEQILALAEALYRAQIQIHHTDAGGTDARSAELNWARDEIRNNGAYWKAQFVKKRRDQLRELEEELATAADDRTATEDRLAAFWESLVMPDADAITIFRLPELRMLVSDMVEQKIRDRFLTSHRHIAPPKTHEFLVGTDGALTRCPVRTVEFDSRKENPPSDLPEEWIANSGAPRHSHYWQPGEPELLADMRLIGTMHKHELQWGDPDRYKLRGLLPLHDIGDAYQVAREGFSSDEFRPYIKYMRPDIERDRILVGVRTKPEIRFFFLGSIMRIHR